MTEITARIRWEPNGYGGFLGYVGSVKDWMFQVWRPGASDWQLDSALPGKFGEHPRDDDPDDLKAVAERWLTEFVTSLGAVFPGGHPDGNAIEAYCATGTGDDRHLLQYAVRLPDSTTKAYGDQSWVESGLGARGHDEGSSTVVRDIWVSYGPWRTHETTPATAGEQE